MGAGQNSSNINQYTIINILFDLIFFQHTFKLQRLADNRLTGQSASELTVSVDTLSNDQETQSDENDDELSNNDDDDAPILPAAKRFRSISRAGRNINALRGG